MKEESDLRKETAESHTCGQEMAVAMGDFGCDFGKNNDLTWCHSGFEAIAV